MTMNLKKVFILTSFSHRLFIVPASERAILFRSSTLVELSYYIIKERTVVLFLNLLIFLTKAEQFYIPERSIIYLFKESSVC